MPKYIEENELREWVQNWFETNRYYHPYSRSNDIPIPELYDILERMPTADVMEVVRCKECKHWERDVIFQDGWCRGRHQPNPNWFCADGERREDDDRNG